MTGKVSNLSNYPQGFNGGLILDGLATHKTHTGKVFYVGDGSAGTGAYLPNTKTPANGNKGTLLDPLKTLGYAVEQCVSGRGDVVVLLPGLVDSLSTAVDIEAANVTILGLGTGNSRPQLTPAVVDCIDVEGDNVTIQNVYFNEIAAERTAGAAAIDVVGAGFRFLGNQVDLGAHDDVFITVTATGEVPVVQGNKFVVTADGTESVVDIEGVIDNPVFKDNLVVTSAAVLDEGFVDMEAIAVTNALFDGNVILGPSALKVASADVGTTVVGGGTAGRVIETASINDELTGTGDEQFTFIIDGNVDIHGVFVTMTEAVDAGDDISLVTESGVTLMVAGEIAAAGVAGDYIFAASPGAAPTVAEVTLSATDLLWGSPLGFRGAAAAEDAIDVLCTGAGESAGTIHIVWSAADDVVTSRVRVAEG
jgi:hypothetical protein